MVKIWRLEGRVGLVEFCEVVIDVVGWGCRRKGSCHFGIWRYRDNDPVVISDFGERVVGMPDWQWSF